LPDVTLPDGFDLDALLAPIRGDTPQGTDVREDYSAQSPYRRLQDIRSEVRDAERQAESPDPDGPSPPETGPLWRPIREIGLKLLTETTKDIEVAAWLAEAFLRSHGLNGLAGCSRLIAGLTERYWDGLFPLPDEYGMETRIAPIVGLTGRGGSGGSLMPPLRKLVLFNRPDGSPVPLYRFQDSARLPTLDEPRRQQRIAAGAIPFDELEKEARTTGAAAMARLREDAVAALDGWEAMTAVLDAKAGADAPSTGQVRDLLREVADIAARYAPASAAGVVEDDPGPPKSAGPEGIATGGTGAPGRASATPAEVASRDDALRHLADIALFFRRTEPHSPLSYTLDEAVRRARLSWPDLLEEIVSDRDTRNTILTALGIRPPPAEE